MFKRYSPLVGRRWLCSIPKEDRVVLSEYGYSQAALKGVNVPSLGGSARAKSSLRIRGRFASIGTITAKKVHKFILKDNSD